MPYLHARTRRNALTRIACAVLAAVLLAALAIQITANLGADASSMKSYSRPEDAAGIDYDRNGTATSTRYEMQSPTIQVGETPADGNDMRAFFPFWVTDPMLAAAKAGGTANVSFRIEKVQNLGNQKLAVEAYTGGALNQASDFHRKATLLATLKPAAGRLGIDVTNLVRSMPGKAYFVLRVRLAALAPKDKVRSTVSVSMHESSAVANRPVLTIAGYPTSSTTAAPATTTTTTPPEQPKPQVPEVTTTGRWSAAAGTTVGSAQYPVPAGAIIVSPQGNDAAAGTAAAPLRTLARAVAVATSGATIVLRGGEYHESVPFSKRLTIQSWPGEAVWLDGSVPVTGWTQSGGAWTVGGWTTEFDTSPTYTRGAPDNTQPYWGFVNESYPLAAHPDQIWIDGVAQRQVGSRAEVVPGTFFHDRAADRLWLGSDPTGHEVRVSELIRALMVRAEGSVVRGIGVRRYAPSVPDMGAVTIERPSVTVENVAVTDTSTTGIHVGSGTTPNVVVRNVYLARNGMLGMNASNADNLTVDRVRSEDNNTERFNTSPVSGGAKIGRTRGVTVTDSVFRGNYGPGLWLDESVYDMRITGNEMRDNAKHGASLEISSKAIFANNIVTGNAGFGVKVNNTSDVTIWNNTFVDNDRSINLVQDARRPTSATTAGRDKRQPFPDPTMTWLLGPVQVMNNVLSDQRAGNCMLCVEDYSQERSAAQIGVTADANVYSRPDTTKPAQLVVWSRGAGNPAVYLTLAAFQAATGQDPNGIALDGEPLVASAGHETAQPLPASLAGLVGLPAGTRYRGAWPR